MRGSTSITHTGAAASFAYTPPARLYGGVRALFALAESVDGAVLAAALRGIWRFSPHTRALVTRHPALEPWMLGSNMVEVDLDSWPLRPFAAHGKVVKRPVVASHLLADSDGCIALISLSPEQLASLDVPPSLSVMAAYCKVNTEPTMVYAALRPYFAGAIVQVGDKVVWGDDVLDVDATAYRLAGLTPHPLLTDLRKEAHQQEKLYDQHS